MNSSVVSLALLSRSCLRKITAMHLIFCQSYIQITVGLIFLDSMWFLPREHARAVLGVVILSVCLSVTRVDCDKTADIFIPHERAITLLL